MYIKIPKLKCVDTLKCPGCNPCFSNCSGRQTVLCSKCTENIEPNSQPTKKRKIQISATADVSNESTVDMQETVVQFSEEAQVIQLSYEHGISSSEVADGDMSAAGIEKFLGRPVLIHRLEWEVGNTTAPAPHAIYPWKLLLFDNPRIREKLATFKLFRGTLKVRIFVNGSPFHYGRLFVGMKPGANSVTNNTLNLDPSVAVTTRNYYDGATPVDWEVNRTFYSQRPHVLVNPNTNSVSEITWPFFVNTPFLNLRTSEFGTECTRMGELEIWELNYLQHAGGATNATIQVSFFAWLEDVVLTGATPNSTATMRKQRGSSSRRSNNNGGDEYNNDGVVSMPATALANFASKFTDYSFIGPYARATQIGANAVGSIAKIFGWSKPTIVEPENFVTKLQLGRMTNTIGQSPLVKLTFDPKQELSVDPGLLDLPRKDEESFSYVSQIEGLFYQEEFSNTDIGHLVGWAVLPNLAPAFNHIDAASNVFTYMQQTPCGFVSTPFQLWRGSLVFRIQFVVSKMHRGRFLLVYTPESDCTLPSDTADVQINSHFSEIIDLSQDTDVSFEVKWSQNAMYSRLVTTTLSTSKWLQTGSSAGDLTITDTACNGRLDLYVLNPLAIASNDDTTAYINLYMRAGDDFSVVRPSSRMASLSYSSNGGTFPLTATSAKDPANEATPEEDLSTQTITKIINPINSTISADALYGAYQGEQIHSIRALCKRYQGYFPMLTEVGTGTGGTTVMTYDIPLFPNGRAGGAYGSSGVDMLGSISNVWMTYLRWFAQAYVAYRGGMRYAMTIPDVQNHFVLFQGRNDFWDPDFHRNESSMTGGTLSFSYVGLMGDNTSFPNSYPKLTDKLVVNGYQSCNASDSASMQCEFPWYSQYRFAYIHSIPGVTGSSETQDNSMNASIRLGHRTLTSNNTTFFHYWQIFVAAAEDTQFHFFFGAPAFYDQDPWLITEETGG